MLVIHTINKTSPAAMWLKILHMYTETLIKIRCIHGPQSVPLISINVKEHLSKPCVAARSSSSCCVDMLVEVAGH